MSRRRKGKCSPFLPDTAAAEEKWEASCKDKLAYTETTAQKIARERGGLRAYPCIFCHAWHLTKRHVDWKPLR